MFRDSYPDLLKKLREARMDVGWSQQEAAEAFGRPCSFIEQTESGERRIDPVELCRFAVIYGKPVGWFLPDEI